MRTGNNPQHSIPAIVVTRIADATFPIRNSLGPLTNRVDVWHLDLEALASAESTWRPLLAADERERAKRFHFEADRLRYSATRALLRLMLAAYLDVDPRSVIFSYSDKGKPELRNAGKAALAFNVSHSGNAALLAVTDHRRIGVDIERIRQDFDTEAIARRFFSAREQEQLQQIPGPDRFAAFFQCWTLKESFIKAIGEGLSHPLDHFDVSFSQTSSVSLTTRPDAAEAASWFMHRLVLDPAYSAALTVSCT